MEVLHEYKGYNGTMILTDTGIIIDAFYLFALRAELNRAGKPAYPCTVKGW